MKRCPQCLFIYPESDQRCDFDNTPLVAVKDSEIDAATNPPRRRRNKTLLIVVAVAVMAAMASFMVYKPGSKNEQSSAPAPVAVAESLPEAPGPSPSPSPSVSPSPSPKASPERVATSHTKSSLNPISTGTGTKQRKAVILLTDGGKIDADEVWRTRDGVWYRRNGLVTLLKHGRVRSIVNQ